jgi:hypothetical protein
LVFFADYFKPLKSSHNYFKTFFGGMYMKKILFIFWALCICIPAMAEEKTFGPIPNYKGTEPAQLYHEIGTTSEVWINNPTGGDPYHVKSRGGQEFTYDTVTPVFAESHYTLVYPGVFFDPDNDYIRLTEIFTYDMQPGLDPNKVPNQRGFYTSNPDIHPYSSQGYFKGISGTKYYFPCETIQTTDLPQRLPDCNISKIQISPGTQVYLLQGIVPASDFVEEPFEFTYEYGGYITQSDPDWQGPKNPLYPYQHKWQLNITKWADVNYISDIEIVQPWEVIPGYIEIVPPSTWHNGGIIIGRYGYEANPGSEIQVGGGSLGFQWRANGKVPAVIPGQVYLTMNKIPVSKIMPTMVVDNQSPKCGDMGYRDADLNRDCVVDFVDLAIFANDWLKCTDPQGLNCSAANPIVGVGFGFNADDANSPATITFLPNPAATPGLDVNDIIVKYQGVTIYSGYQLMDVINARRDPNVGEPVTMEVVKEATGVSAYIVSSAKIVTFGGENTAFSNKKCSPYYRRGRKNCECINYFEVTCGCGYQVIHNPSNDRYYRTLTISSHCSDSMGNQCDGDTIYLR